MSIKCKFSEIHGSTVGRMFCKHVCLDA